MLEVPESLRGTVTLRRGPQLVLLKVRGQQIRFFLSVWWTVLLLRYPCACVAVAMEKTFDFIEITIKLLLDFSNLSNLPHNNNMMLTGDV